MNRSATIRSNECKTKVSAEIDHVAISDRSGFLTDRPNGRVRFIGKSPLSPNSCGLCIYSRCITVYENYFFERFARNM